MHGTDVRLRADAAIARSAAAARRLRQSSARDGRVAAGWPARRRRLGGRRSMPIVAPMPVDTDAVRARVRARDRQRLCRRPAQCAEGDR